MRMGTAMASRISRQAAKSRCACEWGAWGRLSDDGPGQHNPDRSEGPWGRAARLLEWRCSSAPVDPTLSGDSELKAVSTKGGCKLDWRDNWAPHSGKAPLDKPTLKPYWGKPAVRNFRGDGGNVGIIRSPLRASVLPDRSTRPRVLRWVPRGTRRSVNRGIGGLGHGAPKRCNPDADVFVMCGRQQERGRQREFPVRPA